MWCKVVSHMMKKTGGSRQKMKIQNTNTIRASISFPANLYETLEELATQKKVSVAWVVREATEQYIAGAASARRGGRPRAATAQGNARRRS
jgi:predicted DNA-binding ribbon-helix-helix protein